MALSSPVLENVEKDLRQKIADSRGSPFIAHHDLATETEEAVLEELVRVVDGRLRRFLDLIPKYPCTCVRVIATTLAESYGGDHSSTKVYKPIAERLRIGDDVPMHLRRRLHDGFTRACQALGLVLPAIGSDETALRMVDDYLFQAGVSHNQLSKLASAFLRAERDLGLPETDDTKQVDDWEDRAVEFTPAGLSVLRRVVQQDPTGYHGTTFVNIRRDPNMSPTCPFERTFQEAIDRPEKAERGQQSEKVTPRVEFHDGELSLAIPRTAHRLVVQLHDCTYLVSGGRRFVVPLPWPAEIRWRSQSGAGSGQEWQSLRLFSDPTRILVFDGESGVRKVELNSATLTEQRKAPAGPVWLLSQQPFRANGETCHTLGPMAFVLYLEISTGLEICTKDREFDVEVDTRLRLQVDGNRIARNRQGWLISKPTTVQVFGVMGTSSAELEVCVRHPAIGERKRVVRRDPQGNATVHLGLPERGEFGMARISLHIRGQDRALYKLQFWYWPGLAGLVGGRQFEASSIPENLATENLAHIAESEPGVLVLHDNDAYLHALLAFQVDRRIVYFKFPPPGVSVSVRRSDGDERPFKKGAFLVIRNDYASTLIVRCRDHGAAIDVRGSVVAEAFGKSGKWSISFAALNEDGIHNSVRLLRDGPRDVGLDLVKIVREAEPDFFQVTRTTGVRQAVFARFNRAVEEIRIDAQNLLSGESRKVNTSLGTALQAAPGIQASEDRQEVTIEVDGNVYSDGVWFVDFEIRESGRDDWTPIVNASGESYAVCVAPESIQQNLLSSERDLDWLPAEAAEAYIRLTRALGIPIAAPCRQSVNSLLRRVWRHVGTSLAGIGRSGETTLLRACGIAPPAQLREGWLPHHHPVQVASTLFAAPTEDFEQLAYSDLTGYEDFETVALAGLTETVADIRSLDVSEVFLAGFANAATSSTENITRLGAFRFDRYKSLASFMNDERLLSMGHHRRVCEQMADRCALVEMSGTSEILGRTNKTVGNFQRYQTQCFLDPPPALAEESSLVAGTPRLLSELARASRSGQPNSFWETVISYAGMSEEQVRKHVGFVLRLAPELMAFYLLLWVLVERHGE